MVEPYRFQLGALLEADPRMKTVEVLHRMRQAGYSGGKSVLYEMVRSLRNRDLAPLATFADLPGIVSQHDFGAVAIHYTTGKKERIRFFVSRLEFSRYLDVRLIGDHGIESLVRALLAGFEVFGGVPLMVVFDNPRTLVRGRNGRRIQWDETLGRVAVDYRFAPELRTAGGRRTGPARSLVRLVKRSFFRARPFKDRDDLLVQLDVWQREMNTAMPCRTTGATPSSRLVAERGLLRPLAIPPGDYALCFPVEVGPAGTVEFQGRVYTMPPEARGLRGVLCLYPEKVRIIAGGNRSGQWIGVAPEAELAVALVLNGEAGGTDAQVLAGIDWLVAGFGDPLHPMQPNPTCSQKTKAGAGCGSAFALRHTAPALC